MTEYLLSDSWGRSEFVKAESESALIKLASKLCKPFVNINGNHVYADAVQGIIRPVSFEF